MEICEHKIELREPNEITKIYFLGDSHFGSKNSAIEEFEKAINDIIEDGCKHKIFIGMGDYADEICVMDKRYSFENMDEELRFITKQYGFLEKYLIKMKNVGIEICLHVGNHGSKFSKNTSTAFTQELCEKNGFTYLGFASSHILKLKHKGKLLKKWRILTTHGASMGRTPGGAINALENMKKSFFQDAFIQGHNHRLSDDIETTLYQKNGKMINRYEWLGNSGSFLKTYVENTTGYGEEKMYSPMVIGFLSGTFTKDSMFLSKHIY